LNRLCSKNLKVLRMISIFRSLLTLVPPNYLFHQFYSKKTFGFGFGVKI
jgi:hypothetical protein